MTPQTDKPKAEAKSPTDDSDAPPVPENDKPSLDLPKAERDPDAPLTLAEQEQAKVEEAMADLEPGQTVVHSTGGEVTTTGAALSDWTKDAKILSRGGDAVGIKTPIGIVIVTLDVAGNGISTVYVSTRVENQDFQLTESQAILRGA